MGLTVSVGFVLACSGDINAGDSPLGVPNDPSSPYFGGPVGTLGTGGDPSAPTAGASGASGSSAGGGGAGSGSGGTQPGEPLEEGPAPATRFARLTHAQWQNSVVDLLRLTPQERAETDFASTLVADPVQSGFLFDNNAEALEVSEALFLGYQRAASEIAAYATAEPARLAKILPAAGADDEARASQFIDQFGLRAHRRPLSDEQRSEYLAVYDAAAGLYEGLSGFDAGIRLLIEAFLQSPHFLYRVEETEQVEGDRILLDGYEVASRLSFSLWHTMPDDALLTAAGEGELSDESGVAEQARRMLDDSRAEDTVYSFHRQLFDAADFAAISPAPAFFPDAPSELADFAQTEHELFCRDVYSSDGGYRDLLTSTETFVNDELAGIYGLGGDFGSQFERTMLNPAQRKGILTQIGFLASNATSVDPDPIHRGVFVAERIICAHIAAPPADVPPLPDPDGRTNRQLVEEHTQNPDTVCVSCHGTVINPLGFPFEQFDAVGAFRTEDRGQPVDASSEPLVGNERVQVEDALGLVDALADSDTVHECYAKHLVEFVHGRHEADEDAGLIARLGGDSLAGAASIKDLLIALASSESFRTRAIEELP